MSDALNRVLEEARREWGTREAQGIDWSAVDEGLFARIEAERRAERAELAPRANRRTWKVVVAAVAMAAAGVVVVGKTGMQRPLEDDRVGATEDAANIVAIDGEGAVLINGRPTAIGATVRLGDIIEARGAEATLGRAGKLTLVLERGSNATVSHVQGALVLALMVGAVEAQVVPVATGEALAIDVGPSRVAVHGTHLRVARSGDDVTVDLNEGVLSLGVAPRVGSTLGALVTAPAHAEFSARDAQTTLRVTHDPAGVREPVVLAPPSQAKRGAISVTSQPAVGARTEPRDSTPMPMSSSFRAEPRPFAAAPSSSSSAARGEANAESLVAAAVRACVADRPHSDDITIVVSTTLNLQIDPDGSVKAARFEPPVAPDVNTCAARSIYKTRFPHGGALTIPILVKN